MLIFCYSFGLDRHPGHHEVRIFQQKSGNLIFQQKSGNMNCFAPSHTHACCKSIRANTECMYVYRNYFKEVLALPLALSCALHISLSLSSTYFLREVGALLCLLYPLHDLLVIISDNSFPFAENLFALSNPCFLTSLPVWAHSRVCANTL